MYIIENGVIIPPSIHQGLSATNLAKLANVVLNIRDETSARQWLTMVEGINSDYMQAMQDAAQTLIDMQNIGEGTMIDEIVAFGVDLLNAAQTTYNAMSEITTTVNTVLRKVSNFTETALSSFRKMSSTVLGR